MKRLFSVLLSACLLFSIKAQAYFTITNVPDISGSLNGNSTHIPTVPPGAIIFIAYPEGLDTNMLNGFDYFIKENSYYRNSLPYLSDSCSNYIGTSACNKSYIINNLITNIVIYYNVFCSPGFCGWDFSCIVHETGHCFGAGEGMLANDNPYQWIDNYGDKYDPQGITSGVGLNGHWSAPNKELFGFIGVSGFRPLLVATNTGTANYYITDMNSQSQGPKALKILKNRFVIYRTDGELYSDKREFYYLELRPNHNFGTTTTGKGKKRRTTTNIAPAVQIRLAIPPYLVGDSPNTERIQAALINNIGYKGGLKAGQSFSFTQTTSAQVTYNGPITNFIKTITVKIISLDSYNANISVTQ